MELLFVNVEPDTASDDEALDRDLGEWVNRLHGSGPKGRDWRGSLLIPSELSRYAS
jgi:hypothetical protein